MKGHRLRAPSTDGALLATPPLAEAVSQVDANARRRLSAVPLRVRRRCRRSDAMRARRPGTCARMA